MLYPSRSGNSIGAIDDFPEKLKIPSRTQTFAGKYIQVKIELNEG